MLMPISRCRVVLTLTCCWLLLATGTGRSADQPDLSLAVRIGSGPLQVIEFTDPDCPYCRKAASYFQSRQEVTLYLFLTPLASHPAARDKAAWILSAPDPVLAYQQVMSGRYDFQKPPPATAAGLKLLERHLAAGAVARVDSVPTFLLSGRIVEGFDLPRLEPLLNAGGTRPTLLSPVRGDSNPADAEIR